MNDLMNVVDENGLVNIGHPLVLWFPFNNTVVPLLVKNRRNFGYEKFDYGKLTGYTPASAPATAGCIHQQTNITEQVFAYSRLEPSLSPDMFYHSDDDTVIHANMHVRPEVLRIFTRVPKGTAQQDFRGQIASDDLGLEIEFGYKRGFAELVYPPKIKWGVVLSNETNIDLMTYVSFNYAHYGTEFISCPDVILGILKGRIQSHMAPVGGNVELTNFNEMLKLLHAKPVPLLPFYERDDVSLQKIRNALGGS